MCENFEGPNYLRDGAACKIKGPPPLFLPVRTFPTFFAFSKLSPCTTVAASC